MEVMKKYHISRILVIALLIVSLVAYSCYTVPKAYAEAFTLTSLFLMLVMSVMASLGVTLLSNTLQNGIDYLHDQFVNFVATKGFSNIDDYLISAGITSAVKLATPVFGAINIGKTVYDMIAEFCSWFFSENNVVSGGNDVGELPSTAPFSYTGSYGSASSSYWVDDTTFRLVLNVTSSSSSSQSSTLRITLPSDFSTGTVTITLPTASSTTSPSYVSYNNRMVYRLTKNRFSSGWTYNYDTQYGEPAVVSFSSNILNFYISNEYRYYYAESGGSGASYSSNVGNYTLDFVFSAPTSSDGGFVVSPSDDVISAPSIALGQSYSIPSANTRPDDDIENAISDVVAPLTTTGGLSKTASVTGTAVPAEWAWLYEGVESIKNNTSDDRHGTDFIPSSTTMDLGFWHYVPDWISSVGAGFSMLVGVVTSLPPIMLAPLYGILVLGIVVALFHKLWGS